jgi:tetratricopeptide (TPR) repeat protein
MESARRSKGALSLSLALLTLLAACSRQEKSSPERFNAAKAEFDTITKAFHEPSAAANGAERLRLQNEAASRYIAVAKKFPEQSNICAQAWRCIGNIRAAQTNVNEAVKLYSVVGERYPSEQWEVLQAWKSAADLLWDAGRTNEARAFYQRLVTTFGRENEPQIIKAVVRGSRKRLN